MFFNPIALKILSAVGLIFANLNFVVFFKALRTIVFK